MLRIVALNEECSEAEIEEEIAVTKEAQETIAESEYIRAIKLKSQGKAKLALSLLQQLLETKVLNEIFVDDKNDKLWTIRYNCHKNIAIICEETKDFKAALRNYILAIRIDDSDVYTMHRFGHLALQNDELELAEFAFEKCLHYNPSHWNAADGLLQTLYRSQNILGAYGLAVKLYRRDASYERGAEIIRIIASTFKSSVPFFEKFWGLLPVELRKTELPKENSIFNNAHMKYLFLDTCHSSEVTMDIHKFRILSLNWISFGQYITSVYNYLEESGLNILFPLTLKDIVKNSSQNVSEENIVTDPCSINSFESSEFEKTAPGQKMCIALNELEQESEMNEGSNSVTCTLSISDQTGDNVIAKKKSTEGNPAYLDQCTKGDTIDVSKPKPRRRCSDLHFLEQWGWHKNRRYNSRKKAQADRTEVDTSLNGILRKIFAKYFNSSFEKTWPFTCIETVNTNHNSSRQNCVDCKATASIDAFQENTKQDFDAFLNEIEDKSFDLMFLMYEWLKFFSKMWNKSLPEDLKIIYMKIFSLYMRNFDFSSWNEMNNKTMKVCYEICLLFLELQYSTLNNDEREVLTEWKIIFDKLIFRLGWAYIAFENAFDECKLRLINLEYLWHSFHNDLEKCVACLQEMMEIISNKDDTYILHLPNLNSACITKAYIFDNRVELQRQIDLKKVPTLFETNKYSELCHIIKNNISFSREAKDSDNWMVNFRIQIEILLYSLFKMGVYEECIVWAEKFLHYVTYQYLKEVKTSNGQKFWTESVNFILSYLETLILNDGIDILSSLGELLARMVQNIVHLLSSQLDSSFDKSCNPMQELEIKKPWVILHQIILKDESCSPVVVKSKSNEGGEDDDLIPHSFLVLFTAHEFLGKRQWCTRDNGGLLHYILDMVSPNLRAPLYDMCRDVVYEYLEQVTYCLYGYPQKKARSRHLEDHEAITVELTWSRAVQVFDLYRPEYLPEFNSYKLESISADLEQFILKIVALMPEELNPMPATTQISDFINGNVDSCSMETSRFVLPYKINSIFYLLADYYFKNRDFSKAMKYYTLDLAASPIRFDSWAGMALSKASKIETKLNGLTSLDPNSLLTECEYAIRCFEMCINLNRKQTLLWIEYGSFTYTIHSYCSRHLKQSAEKLSIDQINLLKDAKNRMLNISYNCFSLAATLQSTSAENDEDIDDSHEEKWLCQYMLGKIAEKRKEHPKIYLNCYLTAANYLYDSNASYPIKINHSNPTTLSVEALEVFYRTNSSIIKFLEREKEISRDIGNLFNSVLKSLASSPFAFNKAKIDGNSLNALKRKIATEKSEQMKITKVPKLSCDNAVEAVYNKNDENVQSNKAQRKDVTAENVSGHKDVASEQTGKDCKINISSSTSRRESQESAATATTTTVTSSTTSFSSCSDSSSSESETDSEESLGNDPQKPYTLSEIENIYKGVVRNLEECATRFPEHYKSIYRLAYHYMNAPENLRDLCRCEQLLLNQYKTSLENQINGLFYDRKNNNIFNGIWRIPSSEIDRPGSFSAHLVKCAGILIELLMKNNNHKLLIDVSLQLYKTPDQDKRYIKDKERIELYQQSITNCAKIMRSLFKMNADNRNDVEILNLLIDIYKIHKKCVKYMNHKEPVFTQLLVDVYKFYIQDKVECVPENLNFFDLAVKLCLQEISVRKNAEKMNTNPGESMYTSCSLAQLSHTLTRPVSLPGLTLRNRGRPCTGKIISNVNSGTFTCANSMLMPSSTLPSSPLAQLLYLPMEYKSPNINEILSFFKTDYHMSTNSEKNAPTPTNPMYLASSLPAETTITQAKQTNNQMAEQIISSRINTCDITITPAIPKSSVYTSADNKHIHTPPASTNPSSTKTFSDLNPSEDIDLKLFRSKTPTFIPHGEAFIKPVSNAQTIEPAAQGTNPVDFTSISMPNICQSAYEEHTGSSKLLNKGKTSGKHQTSKLCTTISGPFNSTNVIPSPMLSSSGTENYTHQMKLLSTYADLLKNTSLQQFQMPLQKSRSTTAKRKDKQSTAEVNAPIISIKPSSSSCSSVFNQAQAIAHNATPSAQNPFCYPTFDTNAITMTALSTALTQQPITSSFSSTSALQSTAFTQQLQTTISNSPTKTLQQKLAERKKAHQPNESSKPSTGTDGKSSIDVIILD